MLLKKTAGVALAMGGPQNFLGAAWIPFVLRVTPQRLQRRLALHLLSLSPHYFFGPPALEDARNRISREAIAADLIRPKVTPEFRVLDYGCGVGYMANAVSKTVQRVDAVDVSSGALACAKILNSAPAIRYMHVNSWLARVSPHTYDLAYSVAVLQHLTDDDAREMLRSIHERLKPGRALLLHVVIDAPGWRTEQEWQADRTAKGCVRRRYGLQCFTRSSERVESLLASAGFAHYEIEPLSGRTSADDDIAGQHLVTATRPRDDHGALDPSP